MTCMTPLQYKSAIKENEKLLELGEITQDEFDRNECLFGDMLYEYEELKRTEKEEADEED